MSRDSERGIGYLLGHEEPETKAQRIREIKRQIEGSIQPLEMPDPLLTAIPIPITPIKIDPVVEPKDDFGNTKAQKDKMVMGQITRKRKPYDWSVITKPAAKIMNEDADVTSPADAKQKKLPYWINYNGELLDANSAEQWQSVTKRAEEEKLNKISVSDNKVKGSYSPRNEVANRKPKILNTKIGQVKVIGNTNKEPRKMNKEITNKEGYVR